MTDPRQVFWIAVQYDRKPWRYVVEQRRTSATEEQFTVLAKKKKLVITSNRLLFRNKGLKHRRPDYKLIQGEVWNISFLEQIIDAIDKRVNV